MGDILFILFTLGLFAVISFVFLFVTVKSTVHKKHGVSFFISEDYTFDIDRVPLIKVLLVHSLLVVFASILGFVIISERSLLVALLFIFIGYSFMGFVVYYSLKKVSE